MGYWDSIHRIVREAYIILLVIDARMPELSRNKELERIANRMNRPLIPVFNKIDLISQEALTKLRHENKEAFFVSGNKNIGINKLKQGIMIMGKKMGFDRVKVGVVGYPNVGKSAIINCLAHGKRAAVSSIAGTTKGPQFVTAGSLKIIDSPGVIPYTDKELVLGLVNAKNPEKLKNPDKVAMEIVAKMVIENPKFLEDFYGVKVEGDDYDIFLAIGRRRGFLKKGGEVDETKTALHIVRDWQRGKLRL